jgi:hypothetical protein
MTYVYTNLRTRAELSDFLRHYTRSNLQTKHPRAPPAAPSPWIMQYSKTLSKSCLKLCDSSFEKVNMLVEENPRTDRGMLFKNSFFSVCISKPACLLLNCQRLAKLPTLGICFLRGTSYMGKKICERRTKGS